MPTVSIYSFSQAQTELLRRIGRAVSQTNIGGDNAYGRAAVWLNTAQFKLATCTMADDWAQTTSFVTNSGQTEYGLLSNAIPPISDCLGIMVVQVIDETVSPTVRVKLRRRPWQEYRALSMQASARPCLWSRWGNTMALDPQPDDTYTIQIDYKRRPTLDTVEIEAEYQEEWIKLAEAVAWQALDQTDKAAQCMAMLPLLFQQRLAAPLDRDALEAVYDQDLAILPMSLDRSPSYGLT